MKTWPLLIGHFTLVLSKHELDVQFVNNTLCSTFVCFMIIGNMSPLTCKYGLELLV